MEKISFQTVQKACRKAWNYLLDTVAPPDAAIRAIEFMTPARFAEKAAENRPKDTIDNVISLFSYKDPLIKSAILEVKSYGNAKMAKTLAESSHQSLLAELSELEVFQNFTSPILIPIPMTKKSLRKRGWNQVELIAREIARIDQGSSLELRTDILIKSKETADQVGKSRAERFANLKNCFEVRDPEAIRGKNILILDDIVTTGATLGEARKTLLKAGAKKAISVAICH